MDNPFNIGEEAGWFGAFTRHQALGCFRNGTRIVKVMTDPGDANPIGARGTVLGSISDQELGAAYFIEWDGTPKVAVAVEARKIAAASLYNPRDPHWRGWEALAKPAPIEWREGDFKTVEVLVAGLKVGWLARRPAYCDRGHFQINCLLPGLDAADMFPRYYMSRTTAIAETEAWLRWRLWEIRTPDENQNVPPTGTARRGSYRS